MLIAAHLLNKESTLPESGESSIHRIHFNIIIHFSFGPFRYLVETEFPKLSPASLPSQSPGRDGVSQHRQLRSRCRAEFSNAFVF